MWRIATERLWISQRRRRGTCTVSCDRMCNNKFKMNEILTSVSFVRIIITWRKKKWQYGIRAYIAFMWNKENKTNNICSTHSVTKWHAMERTNMDKPSCKEVGVISMSSIAIERTSVWNWQACHVFVQLSHFVKPRSVRMSFGVYNWAPSDRKKLICLSN